MNNPRRPFTLDSFPVDNNFINFNREYSIYYANCAFEKLLNESPTIYGSNLERVWHSDLQHLNADNRKVKAKLLCIEPIVKKECTEHEPSFTEGGFWREGKDPVRCAHCDIKLKTKWVGAE